MTDIDSSQMEEFPAEILCPLGSQLPERLCVPDCPAYQLLAYAEALQGILIDTELTSLPNDMDELTLERQQAEEQRVSQLPIPENIQQAIDDLTKALLTGNLALHTQKHIQSFLTYPKNLGRLKDGLISATLAIGSASCHQIPREKKKALLN